MNEYDIFDAIGSIDDELLERSERKAVRKFPIRKVLIAAAAVMMMVVTVMAAPAIRALLFPSAPVQTTEGKRHVYGDLYRDIEKDEYRIDLNVNSATPLPTEIKEVRLPQYMIDNQWLVAYGEIDAMYSEGPVHFKWWDRETPKWVTFEQIPITENRVTFKLETYHGAELCQETVTVDNFELHYLNIPGYVNHETWESYPELTAVYWSDGEYAYHLECSRDVTEEELAEIILSVGAVEDVAPYLKNDPDNDGMYIESPPLDIHRMPTSLPDGYELKVCADDGWVVTWIWENEVGSTVTFVESHSTIFTNLFTAEQYKEHTGFVREDIDVDGQTVHTFHYDDTWWLIWEDGNFCDLAGFPIPFGHVFSLRWECNATVTREAIFEIMESVIEVDDISQYVTS